MLHGHTVPSGAEQYTIILKKGVMDLWLHVMDREDVNGHIW